MIKRITPALLHFLDVYALRDKTGPESPRALS
jgi:hypothetical protein